MKKVSKAVQTYYSIASIAALTLIGSGFYVFQNFDLIKSSAYQIENTISTAPILSLISKDNFVSGNEATIDLKIDIENDAILSAKINLIYDPSYIEIKNIEGNGILDRAIKSNNDPDAGTINFEFLPLSGVSKSGMIASIKVLPKQKGNTTITYSPTELTSISTLSSSDIIPVLNLIKLTID